MDLGDTLLNFKCPLCTYCLLTLDKLLNILLPQSSHLLGFPGGSDHKESAWSTGDPGSIPRSGRSPGGGNGKQLQCSCLENSMDGGAW